MRTMRRTWTGVLSGILVALLSLATSGWVAQAANLTDDNWVSEGLLGANGQVIALVPDGMGNVYACGNFTLIGDVEANYIAKFDGHAWSPLGTGMDDEVISIAISGTNVYAGGLFTRAGGTQANRVARWDGTSWSALGAGINAEVATLAVSGNTLYAGGLFSEAGGTAVTNIAQWDGTSWSPVGEGLDHWVITLEILEDELYAGGSFTGKVAKWNGLAWTPISGALPPGFDGCRAIKMIGSDLFVCTLFGGSPRVWRWDGSTWSDLGRGPGYGGTARADLAVIGSDLYVGGGFTSIEGVEAANIAKWDGTSWSPVGAGTDGLVRGLAVVGDQLWAAGDFTQAGETAVGGIAIWDGQNWANPTRGGYAAPRILSSDIRDQVRCMVKSGKNVYVGGTFFSQFRGIEANFIAKWDGESWTALGGGVSRTNPLHTSEVNAMLVSGDNVYVAGYFDRAGNTPANSIARWDGQEWHPLGSGFQSPYEEVRSFAMYKGDLYAAGQFTSAGGVPANSIARWDGASWSAVGSGLNAGAIVFALAVKEGVLFAGGSIETAGGNEVHNIAQWDGAAWTPLGPGVSGPVTALAVSGSDLYVGGAFTNAGGVEANSVARWDGASWSPVGEGTLAAGHVYLGGLTLGVILALATHEKEVFMATFSEPSHVAVLRWNGNSWSSPEGSGIGGARIEPVWGWRPPVVWSLAILDNELFLGGDFESAGGKASPMLARAFLQRIPFIEANPGRASVHFRQPHVMPGKTHRIDRTTDFNTWETLGYRHAGETGGIDFTDSDAPEDKAFYQAVPLED